MIRDEDLDADYLLTPEQLRLQRLAERQLAERRRELLRDPRYPDSPVVPGRIAVDLHPLMRRRGLVTRMGPKRSRGKPSVTALQRATGIGKPTCELLVRHPERARGITWMVLARLCYVLQCQPGDLIAYKQSNRAPVLSEQNQLGGG